MLDLIILVLTLMAIPLVTLVQHKKDVVLYVCKKGVMTEVKTQIGVSVTVSRGQWLFQSIEVFTSNQTLTVGWIYGTAHG